jgi:hypothetical protein
VKGPPADEPVFDDAAGRVVRPYSVTNGRTKPSSRLDLVSMVRATGRTPPQMQPEHALVLERCHLATSVAEVAAYLQQPLVVAKVLLSDLIAWEAVTTRAPEFDSPNLAILEAVLDGLRNKQF